MFFLYVLAEFTPMDAPTNPVWCARELATKQRTGAQASNAKSLPTKRPHLFDVDVADNTRAYRESATTLAGEQVVTYTGAIGHIGMAICYDLRFSALFNAMSAKKPLDVIVLPAAFTYTTGKAHWHSLLAARAIEYQSYVVAANQGGVHANGRETFGHTVIYSPWGERITYIEQGCGWISCLLDHALDITQLWQLGWIIDIH